MIKRSRGELKRLAREYLLGNYTAVMFAMVLAFLLPSFLLAPFSAGLTMEWNAAMMMYLLAAVIIEILGRLLQTGVLRMHLLLARRQKTGIGDLFWVFRNRPDRLILATVLFYAILAVPVLAAGVCIYCFLPESTAGRAVFLSGVLAVTAVVELYLIYMFELIYPLYLEHPQMTVLEGFRESERLMQGNKKRLFFLQLSFLGWQLLGLCSIGVGMLWIAPYMRQTTANFYLDLTGSLDSPDKMPEDPDRI